MLFAAVTALALATQSVYGLENSSPFFLYSTSTLNIPSTSDLTSASSISPVLTHLLKQCPTTNYLIVLQSGVSADDFVCPKNTPFMKEKSTSAGADQTAFMIRDVVGSLDVMTLAATVQSSCQKDIKIINSDGLSFPELNSAQLENKIIYTALPSLQPDLSLEDRKVVLQHHDHFMSSLIANYFSDSDYTLLYVTEPAYTAKAADREAHEYDSELSLAEVMHGGELMRRSLAERKSKSSSNQTIIDGSLFDKYQFFTPGIFMGLLVGFLLLSILYVGISALTSLQVTYGAFDKEQGQLANKKQQ